MGMLMRGMAALKRKFDQVIKRKEKDVSKIRANVARDLLGTIGDLLEVWSGRGIRSVQMSNTPGGKLREPHPSRRDYTKDGWWKTHQNFGEAQRGPAKAFGARSLASTNFAMTESVYVTSNAVIWDELNTGNHPYTHPVVRHPVVSEIALAQIRRLYPGVFQ